MSETNNAVEDGEWNLDHYSEVPMPVRSFAPEPLSVKRPGGMRYTCQPFEGKAPAWGVYRGSYSTATLLHTLNIEQADLVRIEISGRNPAEIEIRVDGNVVSSVLDMSV